MNIIEIWQPKYKTNSVLIAKYKTTDEPIYIRFTKAPHLKDMLFVVDGKYVKKCPIVNNGKISCYDVPMDALQRVNNENITKEIERISDEICS